MMFPNYIIKGNFVQQLINFTRPDRYPEIFKTCSSIKKGNLKILSYGCSDGTECKSIRKYFPDADIFGVDINEKILNKAIKNNTDNRISFYQFVPKERFDIIFCMSVLCRHPETVNVDDCTGYYPFVLFEKTLDFLIKILKQNGILVIYNSNFKFLDTKFYNFFEKIESKEEHDSGFVIKFDKNNKKLINQEYKECIFIKMSKLYI